MNIELNEIQQQIIDWANEYIGSDFQFREHQLESISNIVSNIVNENPNTHTQIIEAPTGSGKSLICIISAGVLQKYYKKSSYILCSDLYLWKQYSDFIESYPKINEIFGQLKGQTGNYNCSVNNEDMRHADCRMAKIAWSQLYDNKKARQNGYPCAIHCKYVQDRRKAQQSKITLMTYQLYFYMINVVKPRVNKLTDSHGRSVKAPFESRDIIFCDECHNIPGIVQGQYSPVIKLADLDKLIALYRYNQKFYANNLFAEAFLEEDAETNDTTREPLTNLNTIWKDDFALENEFKKLWKIMLNEKSSKEQDSIAIYDYCQLMLQFKATVDTIDDDIAIKRRNKVNLTKEDLANFKTASWWHNYCCHLSDFNTAIQDCGPQYLIKTNSKKNDTKEDIVTFNCVKEDYMCYKYLINTSENRVLLSATVGMKSSFDENLGIRFTGEESSLSKIPSTFDFSKSPIIFYNRYKLSFKEKEESMRKLKPIIYKMLQTNMKYFKGIIQTASYEFAKDLYNDAPLDLQCRMLIYNNSNEKSDFIEIHKKSHNSILVGPSLSEGIDLPGDLCRFIIILKVPYASLGDKLVKAKMELFPDWYKSDASNNIIQGIGRGNRSKDDWCLTYIMDACWGFLFLNTKEQYAPELQARIKTVY